MDKEYTAVLTRFDYDKKQTLGILEVFKKGEKVYEAKSLELPWKNNERRISCIPEGSYTVKKRTAAESPSRDYDHFIVCNVPDRSYILWHSGNYHWDIEGCLLFGQAHKDLNKDGLKDVTSTMHTIAELYALLPDEFEFSITATLEAKEQIA